MPNEDTYEVYPSDMDAPDECPVCNGPPKYLGTLGPLIWWRCEDCGSEWSLHDTTRALTIDSLTAPQVEILREANVLDVVLR
jgi:hypothetical protein